MIRREWFFDDIYWRFRCGEWTASAQVVPERMDRYYNSWTAALSMNKVEGWASVLMCSKSCVHLRMTFDFFFDEDDERYFEDCLLCLWFLRLISINAASSRPGEPGLFDDPGNSSSPSEMLN